MAKTQDYASMIKDMMTSSPVDTTAVEGFFKSQTALAERMSAVAIEAAQRSTELSAKWAQETLTKISSMTQAKAEPADYAKSLTDFVSQSAESAAEHVAAFAEIAKKVQSETLELLMAAGKDMGEQVSTAAQKVTTEMTEQARQAQATAV